jgi:hypothetical protein
VNLEGVAQTSVQMHTSAFAAREALSLGAALELIMQGY